MTRRAREIETLLLTMFAAVPLYFTYAIGFAPLVVFHAFMAAIVVRVAAGKSPELVPARLMRALAIAYVPFYVIDAVAISRGAVAASTHLVLFIAAYQPIEAMERRNHAQRLLTTSLIFVASIATSTHITVMPFILAFAFLMFRQLMHESHTETVRTIDAPYAEAPSSRTAALYLAGATLIGGAIFPFLPRVRSPFVHGITGELPGSSTALSDTINFSEQRVTPPDATIVARVWMSLQARSVFAPVRLKGTIYDHFENGEWKQTLRGLRAVNFRNGTWYLARGGGVRRPVRLQVRPINGKVFVPVGTYAIHGISTLYEGPTRDTYFTLDNGVLNYEADLATTPEPLRPSSAAHTGYPVTPQIAALARRIVGGETDPRRQAERVESYLSQNFRYVPNPATLGRPVSVDDFLLRTHEGHCEYFAAGMAVLMTALDAPARIVGGFYGGRLNPLTGYYSIRREDAHAWTEVWDGAEWRTYDATPVALRPGTGDTGVLRAYASALGDSITYFWDRYVLTYGLADQIALFSDAITQIRESAESLRTGFAGTVRRATNARNAAFAAAVIALMLLIVTARRRPSLFDLLARSLEARGVAVGPSTTVEEALRALRARSPESAAELEPLVAMYEEERFSAVADRERRRRLKARLRALAQ